MNASRYREDVYRDVQAQVTGAGKPSRDAGAFRVLGRPLGTAQLTFTVPDRKATFETGCFLPATSRAE